MSVLYLKIESDGWKCRDEIEIEIKIEDEKEKKGLLEGLLNSYYILLRSCGCVFDSEPTR